MPNEMKHFCKIPNLEHHPEMATETVFAMPERYLTEQPPSVEPVAGIQTSLRGGPSPGALTKAWAAPEESIECAVAADDTIKNDRSSQLDRLSAALDRKIRDHVLSDARVHQQIGVGVAGAPTGVGVVATGFLQSSAKQYSFEDYMKEGVKAGPGTGLKFDNDKPRMDLLAPEALLEMGKVLAYGANKYDKVNKAFNWRYGMEWHRPLAATFRHLCAWMGGETFDKESGQRHLAHAAVNIMFLITYEMTKTGTDDRWNPPT